MLSISLKSQFRRNFLFDYRENSLNYKRVGNITCAECCKNHFMGITLFQLE